MRVGNVNPKENVLKGDTNLCSEEFSIFVRIKVLTAVQNFSSLYH